MKIQENNSTVKIRLGRTAVLLILNQRCKKRCPYESHSLSLYFIRYVEVSEEAGVDRRSVERWYKKYIRDYFKLTHAKKMQRAKGGGRKLKYPEMDGSLKVSLLFIYFPR